MRTVTRPRRMQQCRKKFSRIDGGRMVKLSTLSQQFPGIFVKLTQLAKAAAANLRRCRGIKEITFLLETSIHVALIHLFA